MSIATEAPWLAVEDVCGLYGVSFATAKKKIHEQSFPVPTYKVGKRHVIDKEVHERYFAAKRQEGLSALEKSTKR